MDVDQKEIEDGLDEAHLRAFSRRVLNDVQALELMIDNKMIERGIRRIGVEQEMFLVDRAGWPAPLAPQVLAQLDDASFTTELARFNLEANSTPVRLKGSCLRRLHQELDKLVAQARQAAMKLDADVVLTGILPTLRLEDLVLENMTPVPRYHALNQAMSRIRGGRFRMAFKGMDELQVDHDNILLESCNTSFQIHFQVGAHEFAKLYNLAQAVTAPVLAAGVNSPMLLTKRLWHETRIALFQQSVDTRSSAHRRRGQRARVSFGERWVNESILEIFREDLARLRVVLAGAEEEDSLALVNDGKVPELWALRLYNGTIYRWNRPCYGVKDGKAHLRIENRALPAGPTLVDEMANAAFYFGLMSSVLEEYGPVDNIMRFDDARGNFISAARHGLNAHFTWVRGTEYKARDLIKETLLPLAREGLKAKKIDEADIDLYLGILEERVDSGQTGSQWILRSWAASDSDGLRLEERQQELVMQMLEAQKAGGPVHRWELAEMRRSRPRWHSLLSVGQSMMTDIFTVSPDDLIDLAASKMEWERVRHIAVESEDGLLVGLVSHRDILRLMGRSDSSTLAVRDVMTRDVISVDPRTRTVVALQLMREEGVGCLPVVEDGHLVGMLTESVFLDVAFTLIEDELNQADRERAGD